MDSSINRHHIEDWTFYLKSRMMFVSFTSRICRRCCAAGHSKLFNSNKGVVQKFSRGNVQFNHGSQYLTVTRGYRLALAFEYLAPVAEIKVPIIWVLGGPGSGKGTQCDRIVEKYGFTHLSSGDLLREEVASGSPRGKELTAIMERGELVPMEVVLDLLKEAILRALPTSKGFLIDGYPREKEQGILFEQNIAPVSVVLFFDASEDTLVERLLGRAKTSGRVDDNEVTIKKRLHTFKTHNDHVIGQYTDKLKKINAERDVDEIFSEVIAYLDPLVS